MKKLNPPRRERAAYANLLNAINQHVLAWGRIVIFPNSAFDIYEKNILPTDKVIADVSRRLGAAGCVSEFSNVENKHTTSLTRSRTAP